MRDPASALEFFVAYGRLDSAERKAMQAAVEEDGRAMGFAVDDLLGGMKIIDELRCEWRAYSDGGGVVVGAPGRGAVASKGSRVRLQREFSPPKRGTSVDLSEAVDHLAAVLWEARREGRPWPNRLEDFADLFDR